MSRYDHIMNDNKNSNPIKKGDYVLVWKPVLTQGKLSTLWAGPFKVVRNYSATSFHLLDPETGAKYRRSVRHMRKIGPIITERLNAKFPELSESQAQENESPNTSMRYNFDSFPFPEQYQS